MAKEYKVGDRLYLPVWITDMETNLMMGPDKNVTTTDAKFSYAYWHGRTMEGKVRYGEPGLLLTAEEVSDFINTAELKASNAELKTRNAELEALLKEVTATRDEAIRQNNELIADRNNWKEAAQRYHDNAKVADAAAEELRAENKKLKAAADKIKDTLVDRTKDVQHLTEENEKLQNKVGELQNRVGEQLAQIQDLNAEVHFHKEFGEGLDKQQKELQARYDELDSVNKEQAEKIRKLDKALTDLKQRNDDLQAENTNLTFLLEDAPKEKTTRPVHVVTNSGTEYMFRTCTKASFDNYGDFTVLKIYEGENYVAGFLRGDSPENFAAWWTE